MKCFRMAWRYYRQHYSDGYLYLRGLYPYCDAVSGSADLPAFFSPEEDQAVPEQVFQLQGRNQAQEVWKVSAPEEGQDTTILDLAGLISVMLSLLPVLNAPRHVHPQLVWLLRLNLPPPQHRGCISRSWTTSALPVPAV